MQHSHHSIQQTTHLVTQWRFATAQHMDSVRAWHVTQVNQMNLNTKQHNMLLRPIVSND